MKKIIPFVKDIKFNTKIFEITSISLENTLTIEENNEVDGEFIVSGDYKMNDSSINTEPFIYGLPFNISLDENYDTDNLKIDVDDFKYEIINEKILRVNIDVSIVGNLKQNEKYEDITPDVIIEAREDNKEQEKQKKEDQKEQDNKDERLIIHDFTKVEESKFNEDVDLFKVEDEPSTKVMKQDNNKKVTSIFENFNSNDEKYVSYFVHIVRENDTLEMISSKYGVDIDSIKEYNNFDQITPGNKLIIPYIKNDETI